MGTKISVFNQCQARETYEIETHDRWRARMSVEARVIEDNLVPAALARFRSASSNPNEWGLLKRDWLVGHQPIKTNQYGQCSVSLLFVARYNTRKGLLRWFKMPQYLTESSKLEVVHSKIQFRSVENFSIFSTFCLFIARSWVVSLLFFYQINKQLNAVFDKGKPHIKKTVPVASGEQIKGEQQG